MSCFRRAANVRSWRISDPRRVSELLIQARTISPRKGSWGSQRSMFSPGHLAARSSTDRLDVHIRRTDTGRKVQAVLDVEPLGDDGYAIAVLT